ncbi:universal stress protein [Altibacter sp.]|uniref:universal stress protein n=1 Tax=Altibacter sp. TaxID=2024823 RepID=UPI000C8BE3F9|nr:universal stress protein [Altibacter sp.]MAP55103.1 universal stress protein [Altibacter sp.]
MKNILIPTDFSKNAQNAIRYALSFFEDTPANFFLLHVSLVEELNEEECFYKYSETVTDQKVIYDPSETLTAELRKVQKLTANTRHHFYAIHEYIHFVEAIRKHVDEKKIDYIVMGTKGASQLNASTIGSHTGEVITRVKCPVLVIPEQARYTPPKNILFPTDFNMYYKSRILKTLSEILRVKEAALRVLYVSKKVHELSSLQQKNRNFLQEHFENKPHHFYYITDLNIDNAIESFVAKNDTDMIAMVAKNLNFFQRILFRPTVEKISYHTKIPFLVLHE